MQLNGPVILADRVVSLAIHAFEELSLIACLAAILPPLINLEGEEHAKGNHGNFDRDPNPVAISKKVGDSPEPSRRWRIVIRLSCDAVRIGHAVVPLER
jgi:hypothetical protein